MIIATIIIGIIALLAARAAGILDTWLGTGAVTAFVLFLAISALPQAQWLFDNLWLCAALWAIVTTFYHRLLSDALRSTPVIVGQRTGIVWQVGRYRLAFAMAVTA